MDAIEAINLRKRYMDAGPFEVLKGISLKVSEGEAIAIMGPNGAGKTTLLRIIALLEKADSGSLKILGYDVMKNWRDAYNTLRGLVTMVFQEPVVFNTSVYKNILMGAKLRGLSDAKKIVYEISEKLELKNVLNRNALKLSTGYKKRVMVARALACRPKILLLDEPTANLDPESRTILINLLKELKGFITIIYVTHYPPETKELGFKNYHMYNGILF